MSELTTGLAWVAVILLAWTAIALPLAVVVGKVLRWSRHREEPQ